MKILLLEAQLTPSVIPMDKKKTRTVRLEIKEDPVKLTDADGTETLSRNAIKVKIGAQHNELEALFMNLLKKSKNGYENVTHAYDVAFFKIRKR